MQGKPGRMGAGFFVQAACFRSGIQIARCFWLMMFFCLILSSPGKTQDSIRLPEPSSDSLNAFAENSRRWAEQQVRKNRLRYNDAKLSAGQSQLFSSIRTLTEQTKQYLESGVDTNGFRNELEDIRKRFETASKGLTESDTGFITSRNLTATNLLINGLIEQASTLADRLEGLLQESGELRTRFDSLSGDSLFFRLPSDSVSVRQYLQRLSLLSLEVKPIDSALNAVGQSLRQLTTAATLLLFAMDAKRLRIEAERERIAHNLIYPELNNVFSPDRRDIPLMPAVDYSLKKISEVLRTYTKGHLRLLIILFALVGLLYFFLRKMRTNMLEQGMTANQLGEQMVLRNPLASAFLMGISVFQFAFPRPPVSFSGLLWLTCGICVTIVFRHFISRYWLRAWLSLLLLYGCAYLTDLLLQVSHVERMAIVVLAAAGVVLCTSLLLKGDRKSLREPRILYPIAVVLLLQFGAMVFGMVGCYNLSKTLLSSGYFNVVVAITMLWSVRLINEMLLLSTTAFTKSYGRFFYLNFNRLSKEVPQYIYYLLGVGWFILFARNFYLYESLAESVSEFLLAERTLGSYQFTIQSIVIFFLILLLATAISRVVSFLASEGSGQQSGGTKKGGLGSWLLLVRISIISVGVLLAFAAAGIPMDRITIVIGALGVGIGFGLQTLVNNLVSGLIIAFEKPVNVGDVVEIGGRSGVMKSIGFRSSIVSTYDGADVVIPNGDLLNQHLVNWTLDSHSRRIEIIVGVAYETDLEMTKNLLLATIEADERVLKMPKPVVLVNNFSASSVDFRMLFWVPSMDVWLAVQSDMRLAVSQAFAKHGISIPYQQVVVHAAAEMDQTKSPSFEGKGNGSAAGEAR
jgi:small-conductance mechanosensitive channel